MDLDRLTPQPTPSAPARPVQRQPAVLPWLLFLGAAAVAVWLAWQLWRPEPIGDPLATSLVAFDKQDRLTVFSAELAPVVASDDSRLFGLVTSRQVAVIVDFVGADRPPIVGLYAEGRVDTQTRRAIMLGEESLTREGDKTSAWVLEAGQVHKRILALGERDPRSGRFVIVSGLKSGDRVLRSPGTRVADAQPYAERQTAVTPPITSGR